MPAGRSHISNGEQWRHAAGAGTDRPGQDARHIVSRFEGIDCRRALDWCVHRKPGLPQVNRIYQAMQLRIEEKFGAGDEYTYLHPALRKTIQAAIIRGWPLAGRDSRTFGEVPAGVQT